MKSLLKTKKQHKDFGKLQVTSLLSYFNNITWVESWNYIKQTYNSILKLY